jgi:AraC family transcriptional regulator of adaptative response / DNA-3-methyladenine glycosylase II
MGLDREQCSRARLARDARFDGKFFIAVLSTGIYCRPICRARTSKESNVRYYETAAAAAQAGFRPCMRCRPECSPATAVWAGTQNTVIRALRLISEQGLEDGGVERLSEQLGVGARHLRRLFLRHLGATPRAVAQTRRLHFAKKLIDETQLPMNELAIAAGFGCVRRFNDAIARVYQRTPTQLRRLAHQTGMPEENEYIFQLSYRPPYRWNNMLAFLRARSIVDMEQTGRNGYARTISLGGKSGFIEITPSPEIHVLTVRVRFDDPRLLFQITERVRAMFDLNADWAAIAKAFQSDPILWRFAQAEPGIRIPGCWDGFELTVRAILGQQVSVRVATTFASRLVQSFGKTYEGKGGLARLFPSAAALADADLNCIGVTRAKAETLRAFARAVLAKKICFDGIVDYREFRARILQIPGIGPWTAEYVAMRALRDPDAFPSGDLVLRQRMGGRSARELERQSQSWRPWRAYAVMLLWQSATEEKVSAARKIA